MPLRVKVGGREEVLVLQVHPSDTMQDVAQQVRQANNTCCCNVTSVLVFLSLISLHVVSRSASPRNGLHSSTCASSVLGRNCFWMTALPRLWGVYCTA
jgi:hypothetical protein